MKKTTCNPPLSMCCDEFAANFGLRNKRFFQDPGSGLLKEGNRILYKCPFCGAEIDPVVSCQICVPKTFMPMSQAWIDNGRYLCSKHGQIVRAEREKRTELGDAA